MVLEKLTPYLYRIKLKRAMLTANHDKLELCRDREVPVWGQRLIQQITAGAGNSEEDGCIKDQGAFKGKLYCVCQTRIQGSS